MLAYGIEILPALGYLHDRGLLFCDFKPDNVIHAEEQLKLIDLGAVRRVDDHVSALWGTPGYQAPELERQGASIASDIYTVGRTLAVLSFDFGGFSTRYAGQPARPGRRRRCWPREESYHRLLLRATHPDPARGSARPARWPSRRSACCARSWPRATACPGRRRRRSSPRNARTFGADAAVAADAGRSDRWPPRLPLPLVDPTDPAAGLLATLGGFDPAGTVATLRGGAGPDRRGERCAWSGR